MGSKEGTSDKIERDSSKFGIRAFLLQEDKPVAYYSKALTPTEIIWFPIEKECLAIIYAAEKLRHFIYRKDMEVKSDQKPFKFMMLLPGSKQCLKTA